jgi:hypothetical protein
MRYSIGALIKSFSLFFLSFLQACPFPGDFFAKKFGFFWVIELFDPICKMYLSSLG